MSNSIPSTPSATAALYRKRDGKLEIFLQRRSKDAERDPDRFGLWGGGIEGEETPEEALLREIEEKSTLFSKSMYLFGSMEMGKQSVTNMYSQRRWGLILKLLLPCRKGSMENSLPKMTRCASQQCAIERESICCGCSISLRISS